MSDILVKGMEMPTSCPCELLGIGYDLYCSFAGGISARVKEYYECCQNGTKPSWCPLASVPAHGKLIEKNAVFELIRSFPNVDRQLPVEFMKALYELPTILEAEEGET